MLTKKGYTYTIIVDISTTYELQGGIIMIQNIGADIGRGYAKGYSLIDGKEKECMFKSVTALGRDMDFKNYSNPIFLDVTLGTEEFKNCFFGDLAEKEGFAPVKNSKDSKTTETVKKLLMAVISRLAIKKEINIVLGVPNREFTKTVLNEVINAYCGKTIEVYDHISKKRVETHINNITIFRESDAALLYQINKSQTNNGNDNVMVNVGFRTTEISYYDNNLNFIDKKSKSLELGNQTVLEYIQKYFPKRTLEEIDSSNRYDEYKKEGYRSLTENIEQTVESSLVNIDEINIYACGGVINNLNLSDKFIITEDPQLITAKGLYFIANKMYK